MNGPTHYSEAEKLLGSLAGKTPEGVNACTQLAQVHATLALVALLVDTHSSRIQPRDLIAEWAEATR